MPVPPKTSKPAFETRQIHVGAEPDPGTGARQVPLFQGNAFMFGSYDRAARLFALDELGPIYTRMGNPTVDVFERRIADLEGGVAAVAMASGQAAETLAIMNLAVAGDHVVSSPCLYGGSYNNLNRTLRDFGINVTFVEDPDDLDQWKAAIRPETKLLFAESIGNPKNNILDISAVAEIAHAHDVPLVVDNTAATPYLIRPLEYGADIVVHSASKFLGGHGVVIGGVVVDGGTFDFAAAGNRFPGLTEIDPSYRLSYWHKFGPGAYAVRMRAHLLRDLGPSMAPFTAWLILQGMETLSLRMERHVHNAQRVAEWLERHPGVERVNYPGLPSSPWHEVAKRYAPLGAGAVFCFVIHGGLEAGRRFVDATSIFSHAANIGDLRSLILHPATTTHSQLSEEERLRADVPPGLVRLSIGLENADDLIADLDEAFASLER